MSTARLTWIVLDRLVPAEEVSAAKVALIARFPELQSLVVQGVMSEDEAVNSLRYRLSRYRGTRQASDRRLIFAAPGKRVAVLVGVTVVASLLVYLARA